MHVLTCSNLKSKKMPAGGGRPGQFLWLARARAVGAGRWLRWLRLRSARSRCTGHLSTWLLREEEDMSMYLPRKISNQGKIDGEGGGIGDFCRWDPRASHDATRGGRLCDPA